MAELLEKTQSSYFPAFKKIFKDVVAGKFFLAFRPLLLLSIAKLIKIKIIIIINM